MHVYFSGIGGTGISALAVIAKEAGYDVSGSDARDSQYLDWLRKEGITDVHVGLTREQIAAVHAKKPIDWFVYGSAQLMDFPDIPEFDFCDEQGIKKSKRDELLNKIISDKNLKLIAAAGTHGKTTTTAMAVWLFKQLEVPVSYSVGAKLSYGEMGEFDPASQYFVYEADEFDRNFLAFSPHLSLIAGLDWDHPDIYPTREDYYDAFCQFLAQSQHSFVWQEDARKLGVVESESLSELDQKDPQIDHQLDLAGHVNRLDAWLVAHALARVFDKPLTELLQILDRFPGLSRRFEQIAPGIYSDYAHTPPKIRGALQLAHEVAGKNVVVIYEGLHNTRQHFIKNELATLFDNIKQLYIVPSYLAREDPDLKLLSPVELLNMLSNSTKQHAQAASLNAELVENIRQHISQNDLVLCLSAGGGGSLDEWLRKEFAQNE
jgi:UDP-N-acetylmuramate--alanine ligase